MDDLDSFLATVDEFVDDENRIVTYKWLSQQLAISANKAKNILQTYAESCKKRDSNTIHIVYAIIGRGSSGMCVKVVRDIDLDAAKEKLDKVLSISLYSVQKAKLSNSSVLYAADYDGDRNNLAECAKFGAITYAGAMRLSKNEIRQQKPPIDNKTISSDLEKQFAKPDKSKSTQQKVNFFAKNKTSPKKKDLELISAPKVDESVKSNKATASIKPKSGVEAFLSKEKNDPFAKSKTKIKEEAKTIKNEEIPSQNEEKKSKTETISTRSSNVEKEPKKSGNSLNEKTENSLKPSFEDDDLKIDDFPDDADFVPKKAKFKTRKVSPKKTSPENNRGSSKTKKNTRKDSNDLPAKKRRRIQELSSSSSEDEEDTEEMDVIPPSPPSNLDQHDENLPAKTQTEVIKNKQMKKVLKSRTFIDEEGFMVTEKHFELEESTEAEPVANGNSEQPKLKANDAKSIDSEIKKKPPSTSTAKQPKIQQKQASIMGFFKKK